MYIYLYEFIYHLRSLLRSEGISELTSVDAIEQGGDKAFDVTGNDIPRVLIETFKGCKGIVING